ncbi:FG-GAP repeat domain-containing protein [Nannocystis bainbridge]|uniref:VCBS repeat-containing protein n=1 Tax=Nannocystis bainbridge TaxID=2995303 RepID=A0ABT5DPJ4_9BACT|nr:VCBS repeat-containing protein [Nannocystis bainbridge]MDC0715570.1 VCBS repeat-containing protein [Nannocystis bainbridge]
MRARLSSLPVAAIAAASCFQVEPLPDCGANAGEGGLHTPHHVCMPRAGAPLELPIAPRRLLRGDFDDEGVDNDFAVLLDLGRIQIHTTRAQKTELSAELEMAGRIEAIAAARFFGEGHGDDLLGVTAGTPATGTAGKVFGFHNGGDMFARTSPEQFDAATLVPWGNCPAPNSIETLDVVGVEKTTGLAIGCESGPAPKDKPDEEPLDGIVVAADDGALFALQRRVGLQIPELTGIHAVNVAQLDGLGFEDIVAAHRPKDSEHESLAIYLVSKDAFTMKADEAERLDIPLSHYEIRRVLLDDLDGDGDVDLVAVHPTARGISVVRQRRSEPLLFEAPQFFEVGQEIRDAVLGDFTGDGEVDVAVAHDVDGTGLNAISVLVRTPDLTPGQVEYALAPAGEVSGEIVDLEPLDYDGDGRIDIGAVLKVGSEGRVFFWLNRSPGGE